MSDDILNPSPRRELVEGIHYYLEGQTWVFTAQYLLERGYCCRNGCRHCPYQTDEPVTLAKDFLSHGKSSGPV
jgi:hypothetical protein